MTEAAEGVAQPYRVVSIDGGGIRGVITAVWLTRLEDRLGGPVRKHADLLAGTSTGAILACALSAGTPASRIVDLYCKYGREVFPGLSSRLWSRASRLFSDGPSAPKYDGKGLDRVLKRQFGTKTTFGELKTPTMVTAYNTLDRVPVVFKNFKRNDTHDHKKLKVWEIVRASASAPTFFPAKVIKIGASRKPLIDGGVVANNPTACAVAEAVRRSPGRRASCAIDGLHVVSFGTGEATRPIPIRSAQEWGTLEWAVPVISVLMDGAADATDYIVRHIVPDKQYVRMQTPLSRGYDDMDDASETNINALISLAESYLDSRAGSRALDKAARLLGQEAA